MESEAVLSDEQKIEATFDRLDKMVGLERAKYEVEGLMAQAVDDDRQRKAGNEVKPRTRNMLFLGGPGTGKTTVAREIATLYHDLGIVEKPDFVEAKKSDFVSEYQGNTPGKTDAFLAAHKGGVIFIDEAYDLVTGESDDYGKQALNQIMQFAENNRDDTVVIMAGYPDRMAELFRHNPGLESRFPKKIHFDDYNRADIGKIAGQMVKGAGRVIRTKDKPAMQAALDHAHAAGTSGNARDVRNLVESIEEARQHRVSAIPETHVKPTDLVTFSAQDISAGTNAYLSGRSTSGPPKPPASRRRVKQG